jgi:hypothetical protein
MVITGRNSAQLLRGCSDCYRPPYLAMIVGLAEPERLALAYVARREIETVALQLEPLSSAIAKLVPGEPPPVPPKTPRPKSQRR